MNSRLGIRWTIGNPAPYGWEALRFSITGAWKLFGDSADYAVCLNALTIPRAQELAGELPCDVQWHDARYDLPDFLWPHLANGIAEGAGWKFAPLRFFPDQPELSLDNDLILWALPHALREWLADPTANRVIAADVTPALGKFQELCGPIARNSGIRGFPPGWDFGHALREVLSENPVLLESELDEQGLAIAALSRDGEPLVVNVNEVTICSPFAPHRPYLGTCGAHFVGLNARQLPWQLDGRPATDYLKEHWERHRGAVRERIGEAATAMTTR